MLKARHTISESGIILAEHEEKLEQEQKEKENRDLTSAERESLEKNDEVSDEVDEHWHTSTTKASHNSDDDWKYIDDGFDEELAEFMQAKGNQSDIVNDIQTALATWRTALNNNHVLDDLMARSQDAPTATAFGDLMDLLNSYDEQAAKSWGTAAQGLKRSMMHLKSAATRLNETMMKTASEVYSDMDQHTTYRELATIAMDPVGYKLRRAIRRQNDRIFERLNTYEDTIRGEKDMGRVIAAFMPQGKGDTGTAREKKRCDQFIKDYSSKTEVKRRPHLIRITNEMCDLAISLEMYTQDYLKDHVADMAFFMTQLSYFEDLRNDPLNAPFFQRLTERTQRKLDIINRIGTSFSPGDFIKNIDKTLKRPDTYKIQGPDESRLSTIMQKGGVDQVSQAHMWDTKVAFDMYKRDRR